MICTDIGISAMTTCYLPNIETSVQPQAPIQRQSENIRLLLRAQFQALQENGLHDLMGILTQL